MWQCKKIGCGGGGIRVSNTSQESDTQITREDCLGNCAKCRLWGITVEIDSVGQA